ncbi:MAG: trypsin-like serine protease [Planctomycetes bacterium]|nr:trypsin-like serine protease [Planctomycetota bacterium]
MLIALALWLVSVAEPPFNGCAWVRAENDGAGAGFVVDVNERYLVTCRHIVADRKKVDVFFPWVRDSALVTDRREYLRNRDALREAKLLVTGTVVYTADETDLALVRLDALPPGARAVKINALFQQPGTPLRVVGHRFDLDTVWNVTAGPLRATGPLTDGYFWRGKKLAAGAHVLIGQLPTEEGDSGGPVFNARGEVVGMVSALRRQCPQAAVAISAREIVLFCGQSCVADRSERPVTEVASLYRATVWIKPTATDVSLAGALIEKDLVLTSARGVSANERVGVAFHLGTDSEPYSTRAAYRDPLALYLNRAWRAGTVIARDAARDLALIKLDSARDGTKALPLAAVVPNAGDALHAMSHPGGLEFAWVYAAGSVRQRGPVALDLGEKAPRVAALVCQLPAQAGSPGGPILNANGELVGVLSAREGAQLVGYAATTDEIRTFLDVALRDRPATTFAGLLARAEDVPANLARRYADALAARAHQLLIGNKPDEAKRLCAAALELDPACLAARRCRVRLLPWAEVPVELDALLERHPHDRDALVSRAEFACTAKDWRLARGHLERVLAVAPEDVAVRQQLAGVLLALGEDAKAAVAIGDVFRVTGARVGSVARDLLAQTDALEQKFPDSPGIAADWLTKALTAAEKGTPDAKQKAALTALLKAAAGAKTDADRLRALRAGVNELGK